jgi:hypothetical protein
MKKMFLLLLVMFSCEISVFSQDVSSNKELFLLGYVSKNTENFEYVVDYIHNAGNEIISTCPEDGLILFTPSVEKIDVYDLARDIECMFGGNCFVKTGLLSFYQSSCYLALQKKE